MALLPLVGPQGRWVITGDSMRPGYWCADPSKLEQLEKGSHQDTKSWLPAPKIDHRNTKPALLPAQDCVALTEEESSAGCGTLTTQQLVEKLHSFWGRPIRVLRGGDSKEWHQQTSWYKQQVQYWNEWLEIFVTENYPFGFVNAWAAALMEPLSCVGKSPSGASNVGGAATPEKRFPLENFISDGGAGFKTRRATAKIHNVGQDNEYLGLTNIQAAGIPRRVWDVCNNRVIPGEWLCSYRDWEIEIWPISHAWAANDDLQYVTTAINNYQWQVPVPKGVKLDSVRDQLLRLGCRYAWLDVLCLRQQDPDPTREKIRLEEWKMDIPTIGLAYRNKRVVVTYFNGLGRSFQPVGFQHERHWLNRAWTLQETKLPNEILLPQADDPKDSLWDTVVGPGFHLRVVNATNELASQINDVGTTLRQRVKELSEWMETAKFPALLTEVNTRAASNPVDRVAVLCGVLKLSQYCNIPTYNPSHSEGKAWERFVMHLTLQAAPETFNVIHELLVHFPHPSSGHWFPSWEQVKGFPHITLTENESPDRPVDRRFRFLMGALHFEYGQLYIPSTFRTSGRSSYVASEGDSEINFTIPGMENAIQSDRISPLTQYFLLDITPVDGSMTPAHLQCYRILLVCRELTTVDPDDDDYFEDDWKRLILRRVTTVLWEHHGEDTLPFKRRIQIRYDPNRTSEDVRFDYTAIF